MAARRAPAPDDAAPDADPAPETADASAAAASSPATLTIEQLSAETGMTVRNIRAHRERGLLPPPEVRERIGYYGEEHATRLRTIQQLQQDGFNLRAIGHMLDRTNARPEQLLTIKHLLDSPFDAEQPEEFELEDLMKRMGPGATPAVLQKAVQAGAIRALGAGRWEAPAPSLLTVAEEVVAHGVPLEHALAVLGKVRHSAESIASEFVRLFLDDVWEPFVADGYPEDRWPAVTEAIERLRPMSSQAILAIYQLVMAQEIDEAFGREVERLSKRRK